MEATPLLERPVPHGPRAYRSRIRAIGPLAALVVPAALGLLALALLSGNHRSAGRGVAGFLFAVFAAPAMLVAGVPLRTGGGAYAFGILVSAGLWLLLGVLASQRATRAPVATWGDFWRELVWLYAGVWAGVVLAVLVANLLLGNALL